MGEERGGGGAWTSMPMIVLGLLIVMRMIPHSFDILDPEQSEMT